MAIDPICGMEINKSTALKVDFEGQTYYFCNSGCMKQFMQDKGLAPPEEEISLLPQMEDAQAGKSTLSITGMHCAACAVTIEKSLKKLHGVSRAAVNFATEKAYVEYDSAEATPNDLEKAVSDAGYGILKENEQLLKLKVIGMDNGHTLGVVEGALKGLHGIVSHKLFTNERAIIDYDPALISKDTIKKAIKDAGHTPVEETTLDREQEARRRDIRILKIKLIIAAAFGIPLLWFAMGHHINLPLPTMSAGTMALLQLLLTTPIIAAGYQFYTVGIRTAVVNRSASMDTLVALGTGTAYLYSLGTSILIWSGNTNYGVSDIYYEVAGMLIAFILLGRLLEAIAKGRTSQSIRKLLELQPKTATVIRNSMEQELPIEEVFLGDIVIVKPGGQVPVDGVVLEGNSSVDQSMLTGESIPVEVNAGDEVIGGTINKSGWFKFEATKVGVDTALAQIVNLVEEAQGSKAPIQRLADRVAAYFVPAVLGIGIITFIIWYFAGPDAVSALKAFIAVIIIACPCALGLATPTAIMVGTGKGAEQGILIKDAETLEKAFKTDAIVFDKTGTLTEGKPKVTDIVSLSDDYKSDDILKLAAVAEKRSEHALSEAIVNKANENGIAIAEADSFSAIPGKGIEAEFENKKLFIGNRALFAEKAMDITSAETGINPLEQDGKTVVIVAADAKVIGLIAIADTIKVHAAATVSWIKEHGKQVIMITGDNQKSAQSIAAQLGIDNVLSEVLPGDKAAEIKRLQEDGLSVAMVGDGINDAPALAQADVGIAIGSGTDVAVEAGEIVLLKDDTRDVVRALELSRYTIRKVKSNLFWAFFYDSVGIPIAAGILYPAFGILLNPMIAGIAMSLSSVSVVTNSLLLKRLNLNRIF